MRNRVFARKNGRVSQPGRARKRIYLGQILFATKIRLFFDNDVFNAHYGRMRVFAYNVHAAVLDLIGFPKESQESFVLDRFGDNQRIPVGQRSRKFIGRQQAVEIKPRVAAMDRNGRYRYGIPNYDGIPWNGQQINNGLGLRLIDGGQIPVFGL